MSNVFFLVSILPWALAAGSAFAEAPRPNFVVILVDDVGYADIGCFGAEGIKTPHLDRMANEGVRFTDFYVHPVCGVTRAALMTGCYAMRVAEADNQKHAHPILHADEMTIAEVLGEAGYATALIGKWHLAGPAPPDKLDPKLLPNGQGFDYWFGTPTHNGTTREIPSHRFRTTLMRDGKLIDDFVDQSEMDTLTKRYTEESIRWIKEHQDQPFFLLLSHNMAHVVLGASEEFRGTSERALYGDTVQELDWSAGEILKTLHELGLDEKTLVIFTSDNGPWVEEHLAGPTPIEDHYGRATPLRGYKMTTWEGGVRVPTIVRWPGTVPAGKDCRQPATIMDLLPTFAQLAGAKLPVGRTLDGRDITPLLKNPQEAKSPHEAIYHYCYTHLQAVRSDNWKLIRPRPANPKWCSWSARMVDEVKDWELYDLSVDMAEKQNVAADHPEVVARLKELLEAGREEIGDYDQPGRGQRRFENGSLRSAGD